MIADSRWQPVTGLGPHGELPGSADQLKLSEGQRAEAREKAFDVAVVLHTTTSDWSKQQIAGIEFALAEYGARVSAVIDCDFDAGQQVRALQQLVGTGPDAVISIPVDNLSTVAAHRQVAAAGIKLVLMDNAPAGMLAGKDYVSVVSADNFGNGQMAAAILADHVPKGGRVGIIRFGVEFFVTNEREIAFRKWMTDHRPDVVLRQAPFLKIEDVPNVVIDFMAVNRDVDALFVPWDEPALQAARALRSLGLERPMSTVDLGNEIAIEIAGGGLVKGVAAQQPFDLGRAEATAAIMALIGLEPPPWVALPALSVTPENLLESYEAVWHRPAPATIRRALEGR